MPAQKALVYEKLFGAIKLEIYSFEGKNGRFLKSSITKIFTDADGNWKNSSFFSAKELESVAQASAEANNFILQNSPAEATPETEA